MASLFQSASRRTAGHYNAAVITGQSSPRRAPGHGDNAIRHEPVTFCSLGTVRWLRALPRPRQKQQQRRSLPYYPVGAREKNIASGERASKKLGPPGVAAAAAGRAAREGSVDLGTLFLFLTRGGKRIGSDSRVLRSKGGCNLELLLEAGGSFAPLVGCGRLVPVSS